MKDPYLIKLKVRWRKTIVRKGLKGKESHITPGSWCGHHQTHAHNNITRARIRQTIDSIFGLFTIFPNELTDHSSQIKESNKSAFIFTFQIEVIMGLVPRGDRKTGFKVKFFS